MVFKNCFVSSCRNDSDTPNKLFLTVPLERKRRERWFQAVNFDPHQGFFRKLYVCEDHFNLEEDAENWMYFKTMGTAIKLKEHVVPHLNLQASTATPPALQLTDSARKRKQAWVEEFYGQRGTKVKRNLFTDQLPEPAPEVAEPPAVTTSTVSSPSGMFVSNPYFSSPLTKKMQQCSAVMERGIQVSIRKRHRSVATMTKKQKHVSRGSSPILMESEMAAKPRTNEEQAKQPSLATSTPVQSLESTSYAPSTTEGSNTKYSNITHARLASTSALMETKSRFYLGLPPEVHCFIEEASKFACVSSRDILITIKKIRQDDVYERLGDDFDMSDSNVQKIFTTTVPKLAGVAQELIFWPDPYSIRKTLPIPFRYRYRRVESIIDCFEVEIEKSSDALVQALTWSEYKKCNTLKYMVSSTPRGMINFISKGFGGRTSDKDIFEKSSFLESLPEGAKVMADRGFKHVAALLTNRGSELIRPPSVYAGEKLSKQQVKENRRIAALRVHIERVIRRIREFAMLNPHSCIHHSLWYLMDQIVIIVCSIVNIQGSLIQK